MPPLKSDFEFLNSTRNETLLLKDAFGFALGWLTVCVSGGGAGWENV